jgi:3-hydroxyisobutyrate dehydrogenase
VSRLGFAGLGDIGGPMAARLLEHAGELQVWNRTAAKAEALLEHGAVWSPSPAALAERCDVIGVCLTSDDAVEDLVFGGEGLLGVRPAHPLTIVNLSTGSAERNQRFAERAEAVGARWVDAPVSGGPAAARKGTLTIFLGGRDDAIADAAPLLDALSAHRSHMGPAGAGQATKLCNQMIVASNVVTIAETIAVARAAGVDVASLPGALKGGFADSMPLQLFGPRMAGHSFLPRLGAVALMAKDVGLARAMAAGAGAATPVMDRIGDLLRQVSEIDGLTQDDDLSVLVRLFEPPLPEAR